MLTLKESKRAEHIRVESVREEFIAGRGLLRLLLGDEARGVEFREGANGKPEIGGAGAIEFNVSHSGGMIVVALSKAGPVGVDVELLDAEFAASEDLLAIGREHFAPAQLARVARGISPEERLLEFYLAWTRKEAVAKADGRGIAEPLDCVFEVCDPVNGDEYRVSVAGNGKQGSSGFVVCGLGMGPHHAGALATVEAPRTICLFDAAGLFC